MWNKFMARRIKSLFTFSLLNGEKLDLDKRDKLRAKKNFEVLFGLEIVEEIFSSLPQTWVAITVITVCLILDIHQDDISSQLFLVVRVIIIIIVQYLSDYSILILKALDRLVLPGTLSTARFDFVIVITWFGTISNNFFLTFTVGVSDGGLAERTLRRVLAGGNRERQGVAMTGLGNNSFFIRDKVSINSNVLTITL